MFFAPLREKRSCSRHKSVGYQFHIFWSFMVAGMDHDMSVYELMNCCESIERSVNHEKMG